MHLGRRKHTIQALINLDSVVGTEKVNPQLTNTTKRKGKKKSLIVKIPPLLILELRVFPCK